MGCCSSSNPVCSINDIACTGSGVCTFMFIMFRTNFLVHGQVTIIFVVSACLFVCLFVCAEFFSAVFDPISIKLGHMLYVWV